MSEHKLFYYIEDVEAQVREAKIIYFLLGMAIGAVAMFGGLLAVGLVYGI